MWFTLLFFHINVVLISKLHGTRQDLSAKARGQFLVEGKGAFELMPGINRLNISEQPKMPDWEGGGGQKWHGYVGKLKISLTLSCFVIFPCIFVVMPEESLYRPLVFSDCHHTGTCGEF